MNRRRKNNIIIGTLCAVLVLMGVGYAILNTTLNIGGTANIKGDFDIHFTRIQRSSSTITDSTLLSTMDNGTGITENTSNHQGTFTAVLQKPTDYVIYDVVVANTGSIDGYLTFTFGDTNNNFNYYKDFYSVEFIRDDVDPDISTDILQQNATFADSEVLENTTGERTYKIKVTFKESATGFPDATTNGDFECTLNLTYSQQAPSGGNSGGNEQQSGLTTYTGTYSNPNDNEFDGTSLSITLQDEQNGTKSIVHFMLGEQDAVPMFEQIGVSFEPYNSNMTITKNYLGITPTTGDYVLGQDGELLAILHDDIIYMQLEIEEDAPVQQLTIGGSSSGGSSSENNEQSSVEPISSNPDWTYKINEQGIITAYNFDHGTDVVVPATINGITVTGIQPVANGGNTPAAFTGGNIAVYEDNGTYKAVINDSTNFNTIKAAFITQYGGIVSEENIQLGLIKDAGESVLGQMYYDVASSTWMGSALTSIDLSNTSITTLKTGNFTAGLGDVGKLTRVILPSTITSIEASAFYSCNNLTDIYTSLSQADFESNVTLGDNWKPDGATVHYNYHG